MPPSAELASARDRHVIRIRTMPSAFFERKNAPNVNDSLRCTDMGDSEGHERQAYLALTQHARARHLPHASLAWIRHMTSTPENELRKLRANTRSEQAE